MTNTGPGRIIAEQQQNLNTNNIYVYYLHFTTRLANLPIASIAKEKGDLTAVFILL